MQRKRYSPDARAQTLTLVAEVGISEAARQTGISVGTVASWAHRAEVRSPDVEELRPAIEAAQLSFAERRQVLAESMATTAAAAVRLLAQRIESGEIGSDTLVRATTGLVDKIQLLTGEATTRIEAGPTANAERRRGTAEAVVLQLAERTGAA